MEQKEKYENNISLIGENKEDIEKIKVKLDLTQNLKENKLENDWNIFTYEIKDNNQVDIFDKIIKKIEEIKKKASYSNEIFSYTIIYSVTEIKEGKKNIKKLLEKLLSKLKNNYYFQPFIILLIDNQKDKNELENFLISKEIPKGFDMRNISCFVSPIKSETSEIIKNKINRIFSYFFSLGDEPEINNKEYKFFISNQDNLNTINILVIGKTQQGKSSFINMLLKEKRAKEGKGKSETKDQISYHLDGIPLMINDIEGFIGENTINNVVKTIDNMQEKLQERELHIVIYIISYEAPTFFNENEYFIFKQLTKKLDNTQFLFVCTKSKENDEDNNKIDDIRESFFQMIKIGLEKKKEKENIINVLNYLYLSVKKDISYSEIFEDDTEENRNKFKKMNFFEKLDLKFKDKEEEDKNSEMIETILQKDETLLFTNLIVDNNHNKIFGMEKVSKQIRKALNYIKENNLKFINNDKKLDKERSKELEKKIKEYQRNIDDYNNEPYLNDPDLNEVRRQMKDDEVDLLKKSNEKLSNLINSDKNIDDLIKSLNQKKITKAREYAEKVKMGKIKQAREDVSAQKILAIISGIFPIGDMIIQYFIKENAKEKIANIFKDDLIDFDKDNNLSEKEKKYLKKVKEDTNDFFGNVSKTVVRAGTIISNILLKTISFSVAGIGILVGMIIGGKQMSDDIEGFLEFYGKRLIYRYLINLSLDDIEKYLIDNFETKEKPIENGNNIE